MDYSQLNSTYKYDMLAENIYSRQMEHFHYDFDKTNFEQMLTTMEEGPQKDSIRQRLADTITQMTIVEHIHDALIAQIDNQAAYDAAVARAEARRAAASA